MVTVAPVQDEAASLIQEACRQNRPLSLAVPDSRAWGLSRARLLSFDPDTARLLITQPEPVRGKQSVQITQGTELGVRFIGEDRRVMFMATVIGFACYYDNSNRREAIELEIASNVACANQRQHYRVAVPEDSPLSMILRDASITQRLGDTEDPPPTYRGTVSDLSIGGALVGGLDGDPHWDLDDHLGVELRIPGEEPLLLIAQIRRIAKEPDGTPSYGLAFIGAETIRKTFDAQEILSAIVTELQRQHLQRRIEGASDEP